MLYSKLKIQNKFDLLENVINLTRQCVSFLFITMQQFAPQGSDSKQHKFIVSHII